MLCYHAVSEDWDAALSVTPASLDAQLGVLRERGYRSATFSEAATSAVEGRIVVVTFDDAYRSVLTLAKPILDRHGYAGTVFAPTAHIGTERPMAWPGIEQWSGGRHEGELIPMSWEELKGLADAGWEVGSHTRTHPHLTELPDDRLASELEGSRADCERELARPCRAIAYPYGDHDPRVVAAAGAAGYAAGCTLPARLHPAEPLRWPRIGVYHADTGPRFRLKVSPALRRLRSTKAWPRTD